MARIGLYPALIIVVFGIVAPFFIFESGRLIGFAPLLVLAFALGLGYGAVKAEYPWVANGLIGNIAFMAASAFLFVVYALSATAPAPSSTKRSRLSVGTKRGAFQTKSKSVLSFPRKRESGGS
jgi:hypothetical protein